MTNRHILTLSCTDQPGIVHAVTSGIFATGGNIIENAQFTDPDSNTFCMRTVVDTEAIQTSSDLEIAVSACLDNENVDTAVLRVRPADRRPNVLIMVSKFDHCLADLLYRWRNGMLAIDIPLIVSNHPDCQPLAGRYDVPFLHLPITSENKAEQEERLTELLTTNNIDLVVLARYMQVLSKDLCEKLRGRVINIHHSFLPGFKGARPYHQAHERGVKLVGATAHFVTPELDEGPIIEQDIARVTHAHTTQQIVELGQDTERIVLARAVKAWAGDRVFQIGPKTVVFP